MKILREGFVSAREPGTPTAVAAGSRCAVTSDGESDLYIRGAVRPGGERLCSMQAFSGDGGETWQEPRPIWPHLQDRFSIFCSVSRAPTGELFLYGTRTPIDTPGESFWSDALQGMKDNDIIWARSFDGGQSGQSRPSFLNRFPAPRRLLERCV